ncbi:MULTISPECIES: hypothetical protein [unclassified Variovorax]|jgi:ferric-dicitrate binding protein FerR (iron transport regulator)|uniref:hypothetical protein n=1 Tax=unclassified Variovorax TaxID=663243 RepID=UPI0008F14221|nr:MULTISPECIES: hypothetical protein [unclassified Variovorax]KAF1073175.1 MAG: hypothetical protein GAK39_00056 [Variovorax sp.]TAJ63059.1 MAG: hypothetical protein EPO53_15950 [Variovorax sp.]SFO04568.1 hypothetical protein SAMN05443579_101425 [Variovorax sp. PDC80]
MSSSHHAISDPACKEAWQLFRELHDAPSLERAQRLVLWLGRDARHVRAFDEALTLWALAGAALVGSVPDDDPRTPSTLQ